MADVCPSAGDLAGLTMAATTRTGDGNMAKRELKALRDQIERHAFLFIIDEASDETGFAVHDRRGGQNLGTWIASAASLDYLVKHGAEAWLEGPHNGGPRET
jgi:hypothetical protein